MPRVTNSGTAVNQSTGPRAVRENCNITQSGKKIQERDIGSAVVNKQIPHLICHESSHYAIGDGRSFSFQFAHQLPLSTRLERPTAFSFGASSETRGCEFMR